LFASVFRIGELPKGEANVRIQISCQVPGPQDEFFHGIKRLQQGVFGRTISKGPLGRGGGTACRCRILARKTISIMEETPAMHIVGKSFLDKLS
jgi:hypothetical protein